MNWDLSVFYKGFDDPQIERDFARCDEITVEKQAVLKQGLSVRETLEKYMALSEEREQTNKYGEYASLSLSTDANNTAAMQLMDRTMQQDVADRMAGAAFSRYLGSLSDEAFEQAIAESEQLQAVDFSLRQDRAAAKHLPAPEIQEWLLKMSLTGSRAFSQLRDKLDATLSVDYRGEKLPLSAVRGKAEDPDPQVRYDAYKAELAAYPQIEQAMAACLNGIKGEALTLMELRHYDSVLDSALDGLGMGLGFTLTLVLMGCVRELLGAGTLFGVAVLGASFEPMTLFITPPGGFLVFGVLMALVVFIETKLGARVTRKVGCEGCPAAGACAGACGEEPGKEGA